MGRGGGKINSSGITALRNSNTVSGGNGVDKPLTLDAIFEALPTGKDIGPNWIEPRAFYVHEAQQFNPAMTLGYLKTIPEIGEKTAKLIIDEFGVECIHRISEDPEILRGLIEKYPNAVNKTSIENLIANWEDIREERGGLIHLDQTVALNLIQKEFDGDEFQNHRKWYLGSASLLKSPADTCPNMVEAGAHLAIHLVQGNRVAVFCDYDVDGTTSGEILRRGVQPYLQDENQLHYGWADAKTGFGLTNEFVREAAEQGCKVLVTLDCGSGQKDQVELAQELGMRVIVVDHHDVDDSNPADFHLNPLLATPRSSEHTGAQLSWKLGAAVQIAVDGKAREDHFRESLKLAGIGCYADSGPVGLPENRAFFWQAAEHVPAGVQALADLVNADGGSEHPEIPGEMVTTQAIMNLPKRTTLVKGDTISKLLAAETKEEAEPLAKELYDFYVNTAKPTKDKMIEESLAKVPEAIRQEDGSFERGLEDDQRIVSVVLDDPDYSGNSGLVASKISKHAQTVGIAFSKTNSLDANGNPLYKFSSRNEAYIRHPLGQLLKDDKLSKACEIEILDQAGEKEIASKVGGHKEVVSGTCAEDKIDEVHEAFESWAKSKKQNFFPKGFSGAMSLVERQVDPDRLSRIEEQAQRFAPFSDRKQIIETRVKGRDPKEEANKALRISVIGKLSKLTVDPEDEKWKQGELILENGDTREIRYPADETVPKGKVEWIINQVGRPGSYYLRLFHENIQDLGERIVPEGAQEGQHAEIAKSRRGYPEWSDPSGKRKSSSSAYQHRKG